MSDEIPPFCVDCKWMHERTEGSYRWSEERYICRNPKLLVRYDLVTGEKYSPSGVKCYTQRINNEGNSPCGPYGDLFEPKEKMNGRVSMDGEV
jgi:hypothetical protein